MSQTIGGSNELVSVTLLTHNAGALLKRVLRGIAGQSIARPVEVVAVDSGSTDGTLEQLRNSGARVVSIAPEDFDFGRTRDLAFQHGRGNIIVSLSQDAVPAHHDWLEYLIAPLTQAEVAVSCGTSLPDPDRAYRQFPWERNGGFYFTREMRSFHLKHGRGVSFSNAAVRRSAWQELRIDPTPLGEDFQFQMKAQAAGWQIAFPEGAQVLHHHDYDLQGLWGRCRNEGLALRQMGFGYGAGDLARDLARPGSYLQWLREMRYGRLRTGAAVLFPVVRPLAVYAGSRFGRAYRPYAHRMEEAA